MDDKSLYDKLSPFRGGLDKLQDKIEEAEDELRLRKDDYFAYLKKYNERARIYCNEVLNDERVSSAYIIMDTLGYNEGLYVSTVNSSGSGHKHHKLPHDILFVEDFDAFISDEKFRLEKEARLKTEQSKKAKLDKERELYEELKRKYEGVDLDA